MLATTALISTVPNTSNFYHLARFICHLFIDGKFQVGHILYEPSAFDGRLITEIESICPHSIPWQTTDITQDIEPWNAYLFTDNVLQLVLLEPEHVEPSTMGPILSEFQFYRVFILSLNDKEVETKAECTEQISILDEVLGFSSLIVYFDYVDGAIEIGKLENIDNVLENLEQRMRPNPNAIVVQNSKTNSDHINLFDWVFGMHDRLLPLLIAIEGIYSSKDETSTILPIFEENPRNIFFANYHYSALNAEYIELSIHDNEYDHGLTRYKVLIPEYRRFHKELAYKYYEQLSLYESSPNR